MVWCALDAASEGWRRLNGHELIADLLADVKFTDGDRATDEVNNNDTIAEKVAV